MASVNKVIVLGNVGRDPELRYTPNGAAVCSISIATTRNWKNKDSGEKMEETEWHRVVFYDRLAEIIGEYVKKGDPLYVEGRLKTRKYVDKDEVERTSTEVIADSMQLLGSRERSGGQSDAPTQRQQPAQTGQRGQTPTQRPAPQRQAAPQRGPNSSTSSHGFDNMDDDIPF